MKESHNIADSPPRSVLGKEGEECVDSPKMPWRRSSLRRLAAKRIITMCQGKREGKGEGEEGARSVGPSGIARHLAAKLGQKKGKKGEEGPDLRPIALTRFGFIFTGKREREGKRRG